ncbi:MAG: hypothetical protein ACRCXL_13950 [Dermatophilaceae bacterium]
MAGLRREGVLRSEDDVNDLLTRPKRVADIGVGPDARVGSRRHLTGHEDVTLDRWRQLSIRMMNLHHSSPARSEHRTRGYLPL